jgi:hypothetical protein
MVQKPFNTGWPASETQEGLQFIVSHTEMEAAGVDSQAPEQTHKRNGEVCPT